MDNETKDTFDQIEYINKCWNSQDTISSDIVDDSLSYCTGSGNVRTMKSVSPDRPNEFNIRMGALLEKEYCAQMITKTPYERIHKDIDVRKIVNYYFEIKRIHIRIQNKEDRISRYAKSILICAFLIVLASSFQIIKLF